MHETRTSVLSTNPVDPRPSAALCVHSLAARAAAFVQTREFVETTTAEAPDVPADRDHRIRITVWSTCTECQRPVKP